LWFQRPNPDVSDHETHYQASGFKRILALPLDKFRGGASNWKTNTSFYNLAIN